MKPTKDELAKAVEYLRIHVDRDWRPNLAASIDTVLAALDASYDGAVLDQHSGASKGREWVTVSTWLYPGDKVVVQSA